MTRVPGKSIRASHGCRRLVGNRRDGATMIDRRNFDETPTGQPSQSRSTGRANT